MNTQLNIQNSLKGHLKAISKLIIPVLLAASTSLHAAESYQLKVLFTPSAGILLAEASGRVMIYEGLKNETVELAMNDHFDRIENMMFIGTVYELENGDLAVEDDDC